MRPCLRLLLCLSSSVFHVVFAKPIVTATEVHSCKASASSLLQRSSFGFVRQLRAAPFSISGERSSKSGTTLAQENVSSVLAEQRRSSSALQCDQCYNPDGLGTQCLSVNDDSTPCSGCTPVLSGASHCPDGSCKGKLCEKAYPCNQCYNPDGQGTQCVRMSDDLTPCVSCAPDLSGGSHCPDGTCKGKLCQEGTSEPTPDPPPPETTCDQCYNPDGLGAQCVSMNDDSTPCSGCTPVLSGTSHCPDNSCKGKLCEEGTLEPTPLPPPPSTPNPPTSGTPCDICYNPKGTHCVRMSDGLTACLGCIPVISGESHCPDGTCKGKVCEEGTLEPVPAPPPQATPSPPLSSSLEPI